MALIHAVRRILPSSNTASGSGAQEIDASLQGELYTMPWKQRRVLEGKGFRITVGALSTPIQGGGAGTVLDIDQPEFLISVPTGTAIYPLRVHIECQVPLLAADSEEAEILLAVDRTQVWNAVGASTAETVFNMRTDNPYGSVCTAISAFTGDITSAPVLGIELDRSQLLGDFQGTPANGMWTPLALKYEPETPELIVGPAMLLGYWGGTVAVTGFAQVAWIEVSTPATS